MQHFFIGSIDLIKVIYLFTVETLYLDVITSSCTLNHHRYNEEKLIETLQLRYVLLFSSNDVHWGVWGRAPSKGGGSGGRGTLQPGIGITKMSLNCRQIE